MVYVIIFWTNTDLNLGDGVNGPFLGYKTLAGQLYSEKKEFFPENAVKYFVSYYNFAWFCFIEPVKCQFYPVFTDFLFL